MHRRQFLALCTSIALAPVAVFAIPPQSFDATDWASVSYVGSGSGQLKSVTAQVSTWADDAAAEAHRQLVLQGAGWVPDGEFYATTPQAVTVPPGLTGIETGFATWRTIVGAAGVQTDHALVAWRDGAVLGEVRVLSQPDGPAQSLAADLGVAMYQRWRANPRALAGALPVAADFPEPMTVDYTASPNGAFNGQGTPIPEPPTSPVP